MSTGLRRSAVVMAGLSLFSTIVFAGWVQLNSGTLALLMSVHFPEGTQVGYAVGADPAGGGAIVKTTDGGDNWELQYSGVMNGLLNAVYFTDNNNGCAVGTLGTAIRTTDGGQTWIAMTLSGSDDLTGVQFPENGQVGYIFSRPRSGAPSRLLKTTDGGSTWFAISVGRSADVTRGGSFANDSVGVIVGDDGLVLGAPGGQYQDAQTNADLVAAAFAPTDPNKAYLIGNDSTHGVIRYAADGGATPWDSVRCWDVTRFYGVTMADSIFGFVCGSGGNILISVSPTDFCRTTTGVTADMHGVCFPHGTDTGYAVGAGGTILRTYDGGIPWWDWVAESKVPAMSRTGIRVMSNPSRRGIAFDADRAANVVVLDAAGRVVKTQAANKGLNFLPMSKAGVYFVTTEARTIRVVLSE